MGAIFYRQFSDGPNPYMTLAGEEYVRPLSIGSDWNTIRLAMICSLTPINPAIPATISGCDFFFGVCNYGGGSWASSTCANAVGIGALTGFYPILFTYTVSSWPYFSAGNLVGNTRINNVITRPGTPFLNTLFPVIGRKWMISCIITKSVGAATSNFNCSTVTSSASADWRYIHIADLLDTAATGPSIYIDGVNTGTSGSGALTSLTISDAAGPLNAVNLYWNKAIAPLEVYAIAASRLG